MRCDSRRCVPLVAVAALTAFGWGLSGTHVAGAASAATAGPPALPQPLQAFDACAAPSLSTMQIWRDSSPFTSVGIYVGGANRKCAQPNLTTSWITTVTGQGWKLLPIWVGPQAPCTTLSSTKLPGDEFGSLIAGYTEALAAADRMNLFGFGWLAPVYYDMEAYPRDTSCIKAIQAFSIGWTYGLNGSGYLAGLYSSQCSGIVDVAAIYNTAKYRLNAIWIAAWNTTPKIFGFTGTCAVSDSYWPDHQRLHQFIDEHDETWGGVTIKIDSNAVDGPTNPL